MTKKRDYFMFTQGCVRCADFTLGYHMSPLRGLGDLGNDQASSPLEIDWLAVFFEMMNPRLLCPYRALNISRLQTQGVASLGPGLYSCSPSGCPNFEMRPRARRYMGLAWLSSQAVASGRMAGQANVLERSQAFVR